MSDENARWALYPWFEEHGSDLIHPEDLASVRGSMPYGKVFRVLGEEDGFVRLGYGGTQFRARPALLVPLTTRAHGVGEAVTLHDGREGEVLEVGWHYQRAEPFYQLRLEGKKTSKRHWNADFASG